MNENKIVDVKENETLSIEETLERERTFAPLVDIFETEDNFVLIANMPGVSKENVKLKMEEGALTIFGKLDDYDEVMDRKYVLNESEIGNFYRSFRISNSIDDSKIEAKFENGQLIVTLPKHERIKPKEINIH